MRGRLQKRSHGCLSGHNPRFQISYPSGSTYTFHEISNRKGKVCVESGNYRASYSHAYFFPMKKDWTKGIDYRRRLAFCQNVIPRIMRKFSFLNEKEFLLEEEAWLNLHNNSLKIKSRNITWANYAQMCEESKFVPSEDNPNWTKFEQHGQVSIINFGPFSRVLEIFAGKFLLKGAHKALSIMEELLYEKSTSRDT